MATARTLLAGAAAAVLLATPLLLTGCGWEPLYADRESEPADDALRTITVAPIPERIGQRLAMALRNSLNPGAEPSPKQYVLRTTLSQTFADLGIQSQGLATRGKLDVTATYTLSEILTNKPVLTNTVHVADSFDILANGYATVVAQEDSRDRTVEELRREIVTRLQLFMQRRAAEQAALPAAAR